MIDASSLSYRSVCPCRLVAKKQIGKTNPFCCLSTDTASYQLVTSARFSVTAAVVANMG
jgi:hypothetical protein